MPTDSPLQESERGPSIQAVLHVLGITLGVAEINGRWGGDATAQIDWGTLRHAAHAHRCELCNAETEREDQ